MGVIGIQNRLQSFGTAPVIHGGERDALLFPDGFDVAGDEECSLGVRVLGKELPDGRLKPAGSYRCEAAEEHFDHPR